MRESVKPFLSDNLPKNNQLPTYRIVLEKEKSIISKYRTPDLHGLGHNNFKVTTPSYDLHLILLEEILIRQEEGGSRAQIGLNAEG